MPWTPMATGLHMPRESDPSPVAVAVIILAGIVALIAGMVL